MALPDAVPIYALEKHLPVRIRPAVRLSDDELLDLALSQPRAAHRAHRGR